MDNISGSIKQMEAIFDDLENLEHFASRIERSLRNDLRETGQSPRGDGNQTKADVGLWKLDEVLPWLYRGSALLTILGFFEHNLNVVCESLRKELNLSARITTLPGKGLRRSKIYLAKHIGIDFPADAESWAYLLKYSDIRNLIAHRDSLVKDDDPELIRFINDNPHLIIDTTGRVRLREGALSELIDYLDSFFRQLAERIGHFYSRGKI